MNKIFQFEFDIPPGEKREIVMALLEILDFDGFEEKEHALLGVREIEESCLAAEKEKIEQIFPIKSVVVLENKNWNAVWESGFDPVLVNDLQGQPFVYIRAGFHPPKSNVPHELVITPRMSFGTGHHATTALMVAAMGSLDIKGKSVIDFGTGTGILAILAQKLGAASILAIDNDEWSMANARENIIENKGGDGSIDLIRRNQFPSGNKFDIILANINLNVILENLPTLLSSCKPGGILLLSGLLVSDEPKILSRIPGGYFEKTEVQTLDGWILIRLNMRGYSTD